LLIISISDFYCYGALLLTAVLSVRPSVRLSDTLVSHPPLLGLRYQNTFPALNKAMFL